MELIIFAGFVTGLAVILGRLALTYPVDSHALIAESLVHRRS